MTARYTADTSQDLVEHASFIFLALPPALFLSACRYSVQIPTSTDISKALPSERSDSPSSRAPEIVRPVGVDFGVRFTLFQSKLRHVNPKRRRCALCKVACSAFAARVTEISEVLGRSIARTAWRLLPRRALPGSRPRTALPRRSIVSTAPCH